MKTKSEAMFKEFLRWAAEWHRRETHGMQHITDTYARDAARGGRDAHRITIADALYWWERGLATPISGDDMYRPKEKDPAR